MAPPNAVLLSLLVCLLSSIIAQAQLAPNVTYQQLWKSFPPSAYVYNPTDTLAASNNVTQLLNAGGTSTKRSVAEWPALAGEGLAQTVFTLGPCGLRQPHTHPRASGILYAIQAANLQVGVVLLDGTQVVNNITTGASTIFPQGLMHYQQNLDCQPAKYIITYNDAEAQTVNAVPALMNLPATALEQVLGLTSAQYELLKANAVAANFVPGSDPTCMARCGLTLPATSKIGGGRRRAA